MRPLLSSVSLSSQEQSGPSEQLLVGTALPPLPEQLPPHWLSILTSLNGQEPLVALQEVDHLTNKKPQFLRHISQNLYTYINSHSSQIRNVSLLLLLRYLKYNPKAASEALPAILSCLDSKNADIVDAVLDKLPEILATMQEYAKLILMRVFSMGVNHNLNTSPHISKCISLLSLQSGC